MTNRTRSTNNPTKTKSKCSGCSKQFSFLPYRVKGEPICFTCKAKMDINIRSKGRKRFVKESQEVEISSSTTPVDDVQAVHRQPSLEEIFADV